MGEWVRERADERRRREGQEKRPPVRASNTTHAADRRHRRTGRGKGGADIYIARLRSVSRHTSATRRKFRVLSLAFLSASTYLIRRLRKMETAFFYRCICSVWDLVNTTTTYYHASSWWRLRLHCHYCELTRVLMYGRPPPGGGPPRGGPARMLKAGPPPPGGRGPPPRPPGG